jgi:hypothetical protein
MKCRTRCALPNELIGIVPEHECMKGTETETGISLLALASVPSIAIVSARYENRSFVLGEQEEEK